MNGTLISGASIQSDAVRSNVLNLSASSQYVGLPVAAGGAQTFSGWVKWNGRGAWQRVFDFGQDAEHWFMLTPLDGSGKMQCALSAARSAYVQVLQAPTALPVNTWTHVAVVIDGRQGVLYSNAVAIAVNNCVNLLPSDIASTSCYFGRSHYSADPYFGGRLDSVRLNSQPLSIAEITAPAPVIVAPSAHPFSQQQQRCANPLLARLGGTIRIVPNHGSQTTSHMVAFDQLPGFNIQPVSSPGSNGLDPGIFQAPEPVR